MIKQNTPSCLVQVCNHDENRFRKDCAETKLFGANPVRKWRQRGYDSLRNKKAMHISEQEWNRILNYLESRGFELSNATPTQAKALFDQSSQWECANLSKWWFNSQTALECLAGFRASFQCFVLRTQRARRALYWLLDLKLHSASYLDALEEANRFGCEENNAESWLNLEDPGPVPPKGMRFKSRSLEFADSVYLRSCEQVRLLYSALYLSPFPPVTPGRELWNLLWTKPNPSVPCVIWACREKGLPKELIILVVSFIPAPKYPVKFFARRWLKQVQSGAKSIEQ